MQEMQNRYLITSSKIRMHLEKYSILVSPKKAVSLDTPLEDFRMILPLHAKI
jgi:hypothetical protein